MHAITPTFTRAMYKRLACYAARRNQPTQSYRKRGVAGLVVAHVPGRMAEGELDTGDTNKELAYHLKSHKCYSSAAFTYDQVEENLNLYAHLCSVRTSLFGVAAAGATLAAGGKTTAGARLFSSAVAREVLSTMSTCGLYDGSSEFLNMVGIPAKSGVGGLVLAIVPGRFSVAIQSPLLDAKFDSVKGIEFLRLMIEKWPFLHCLDINDVEEENDVFGKKYAKSDKEMEGESSEVNSDEDDTPPVPKKNFIQRVVKNASKVFGRKAKKVKESKVKKNFEKESDGFWKCKYDGCTKKCKGDLTSGTGNFHRHWKLH